MYKTLSMIGAPVAKAFTPTVGTVKPSAKLALKQLLIIVDKFD